MLKTISKMEVVIEQSEINEVAVSLHQVRAKHHGFDPTDYGRSSKEYVAFYQTLARLLLTAETPKP